MLFQDRLDAARQLAQKLQEYLDQNKIPTSKLVIFGLLRGGYLIAYHLAQKFNLQAYPYFVKKLGSPNNLEFAIGAVGQKQFLIDQAYAKLEGVDETYIKEKIEYLRGQIKEQKKALKQKSEPKLKNKVVVLADDGVATGLSVSLAVEEVLVQEPRDIIVATPVIPLEALDDLERKVKVIYLEAPEDFYAVGQFYKRFNEVGLDEVKELLTK